MPSPDYILARSHNTVMPPEITSLVPSRLRDVRIDELFKEDPYGLSLSILNPIHLLLFLLSRLPEADLA